MPYYQGDYYRGDIFSDIFHGVTGAIGGLISSGGNPLGAIVGGLKGAGVIKSPAPTFSPGTSLVAPTLQAPSYMPAPPGSIKQFGLINTNTAPTMPGGGMIAPSMGAVGPVPGMRGYHMNKSTYETRGGGTSRWGGAGTLSIHPKGTVAVKNRRMNVGNAKALRHALRRAYGFERLARRVLHLTSPKRHFSGFKKRRTRR